MLLVTHIVIALTSVLYSGLVWLRPSRTRLYGSYAMLGLTVVSGTALVVLTHAPMLQSCMTGLFYICLTLAGIVLASHKLATQEHQG